MCALGIDIGGSGIKGAVVDIESGELKNKRHRIPTPKPSKPEAVAEVICQIAEFFEWSGPVGCGYPGVVQHGVTRTAANVDERWIDFDAAVYLSAQIGGSPVTVINDADAAGLAEMRFGIGQEWQRGVAVLVTIGTGLGTAVFTNGQLVPNTELGHIEIDGHDAERYATDAARKREDMSWEEWAKHFNKYLETLEKYLSPDVFILGGGASKKVEKFLPYLTTRAKVVPALLRNEAGIIGAALATTLPQ
jgi:polyphosphate glucokinase